MDNRLALVFQTAGRMAWDVLQGSVFRTAGSRYARDGQRMQRYFRDAATVVGDAGYLAGVLDLARTGRGGPCSPPWDPRRRA